MQRLLHVRPIAGFAVARALHCGTGMPPRKNTVRFGEVMTGIHEAFAAGDHESALVRSRELRRLLRRRRLVDPEQLGWAVYYEFRCLYALGRTAEAWELLHSDERRMSRIPLASEGWMCSVGAELAANLGLVEEVLRLGEECLFLRQELGDVANEIMCCRTVCVLLDRLGCPDRKHEFTAYLENLTRPRVAHASYRAPSQDGDSLEQRLFVRGLAARNKAEPVTVRGFERLWLVLQHGFERVGYESHMREDGCMFWLTDAHARAIGHALSPTLRHFHLGLTTFEGRGFHHMAAAAANGLSLDTLVVHHRSGDEFTVVEAQGLAQLVDTLAVRTLRVWALEYQPGARDALASELRRLANRTLADLEVCDLDEPEPSDARQRASGTTP